MSNDVMKRKTPHVAPDRAELQRRLDDMWNRVQSVAAQGPAVSETALDELAVELERLDRDMTAERVRMTSIVEDVEFEPSAPGGHVPDLFGVMQLLRQ